MTPAQLHQKELELLYSKNQIIPRIYAEFKNCKQPDFGAYMRSRHIDEAFGFALLVQMALHKRCDLPTLVGILRGYMPTADHVARELEKCAHADLVDWEDSIERFIVKFEISEDVQEELDRFQFPLPMVIEPKEVTNNRQTGYMINSGSIILKNNHHEDDVCLDHINRMNKIKLVINKDTVRMVRNKWRKLDKPKQGESRKDYEKRVRAFEKYDRTTHDVIAILEKETDMFNLTHRYCKRGRTYCQGYHVNYQGAPWNKAVVELADKEYID